MNIPVNACLLLAVFLSFCAATNSAAQAVDDTIKSDLFEALASAESELEGKTAEDAIWRYWFDQAPTPDVRASLDSGMARRDAYDFEAAEGHLDVTIKQAPYYAEGYNQRAFVRFLRENYTGAQADLETALELEPDHFGALSGLYHVLSKLKQQPAALEMLRLAVTIHPWLKERSALPNALWPKSFRDIHDPDHSI